MPRIVSISLTLLLFLLAWVSPASATMIRAVAPVFKIGPPQAATGQANVSETYTYGNASNGKNSNQLHSLAKTGAALVTYTYDLNGSRTGKLEGSSLRESLEWDSYNRLVRFVKHADAKVFQYAYDHRTRRVLRDESAAGAGGQLTLCSYSGGTSVFEKVGGSVTVEYIRGGDMGGGVGGLLYTARGGSLAFKTSNHRGDVVAQTDASGILTWQASYEAFGKRTAEAGSNPDRQKANTKEEDPTGLLNEGFRYRDLETGMFISRDPLGFVDGPNVYTYVRQNPWTFFDPHGLDMKRAGENLDSALRALEGMFTRNPSEGMEAGAKLIEAAMEVVDSGIDKISGNARGGENAVEYAAGFNPVVAAAETAQEIDEKGVSVAVVTGIVVEKTLGKIPGLKGKGDEIVDSARGVQKKAAAAVERAKNLEKGIPASHLGPSGKPKVHVVKKPTDKQAKDAARQHGKSKPEKHTQDAGQPTHYHGTDSTGEKLKGKDNVHFQKRGEKPNPPKEEKAEP